MAKQAHITSEQGICKTIVLSCLNEVWDKTKTLFPDIQNYHNEPDAQSETDSHLIQIIKEAAKQYTIMRLQTYAKGVNHVMVNICRASVRHKMIKCIIFNNQ